MLINYEQEAVKVKQALRARFPEDTIAVEQGYEGRVRVKIVSERFNGLTEREKQDVVWDILRAALGNEAQVVSIALAYGTDEL